MKKTLGGDRLGSGNKMTVDLHGYERSTHDLGYLWRSTMSAGTLVPFLNIPALPGDTFDMHMAMDGKTHPTIGPLFGSYKVQLDVFQAPIRLYNSLLHNNALGIGMDMSVVKFPIIELVAKPIDPETVEDIDNCQINPSCLLSYLGIRGIGYTESGDIPREFNAIPILAYWEIYKQYYSNKMEEIGAVIHTPAVAIPNDPDTIDIGGNALPEFPSQDPGLLATFGTLIEINYTTTPPLPEQIILHTVEHGDITAAQAGASAWQDSGTVLSNTFRATFYGPTLIQYWRMADYTDQNNGKPGISTFFLSEIDEMRQNLLAYNSTTTPYDIATGSLKPYLYLTEQPNGIPNILSSQEGLGLKTYQSDLLNNWLLTEWIDGTTGINAITAIDTSGGSFTIDTLNLSKKVYDMLNRIAVSGGTYDDWLDAVYAHDRYTRCESPMYCGGLIKELVFQEVVSNSQNEDQPLGTLAGKGTMSKKNKGGHVIIKVDEPSYIIGIVSLTPRIDYSQGNDWHIHLQNMNDLHKPALDEIGFQELITEQAAWWDTHWDAGTSQWIQRSAGKQPAWINYMTAINKTFGNFAAQSNEMFMTLNRRYEQDTDTGYIADMTTYIDPSKFNFIFAETALDAQNFWIQIAVDITARRKMSAKVMPNL